MMVQLIKEIVVLHSDEDVYAMLKECFMDPNEAVQKLLDLGIWLHISFLRVLLLFVDFMDSEQQELVRRRKFDSIEVRFWI